MQIHDSYFKQLTHIQTEVEHIVDFDNIRWEIEDACIATLSLIDNKLRQMRVELNLDSTILNQSRIESSITHHLPNLKSPKLDSRYS